MLRPWRREGRELPNSRTSTTTRGGSAVAARRPPPAMRVFTVRRNCSCGSSAAFPSSERVTDIFYHGVSLIVLLGRAANLRLSP